MLLGSCLIYIVFIISFGIYVYYTYYDSSWILFSDLLNEDYVYLLLKIYIVKMLAE